MADKTWQVIKSNDLKNTGINVWVYEADDVVFTGVGLKKTPNPDVKLERKSIRLLKYAYYKHTGSYNPLRQVAQNMRMELENKKLETAFPYIEIYGHWTSDETKLETELLISLK